MRDHSLEKKGIRNMRVCWNGHAHGETPKRNLSLIHKGQFVGEKVNKGTCVSVRTDTHMTKTQRAIYLSFGSPLEEMIRA